MSNVSASADDIKAYLKGLVKLRTWIDIHEALNDQVQIDLSVALNGKEKIPFSVVALVVLMACWYAP